MNDSAQHSGSVLARLIAEARRRHLFRTAGLYAAGAFVILQLADIMMPGLGLPDSAINYLLIAIAAGFPIALVVVWIIDLSGDRELTPSRVIDAVIVAIALGVGFMYLERLTGIGLTEVAIEKIGVEEAAERVPVVPIETTVLHNSIAVLPFENLSPDPDNAYFAAGIHEEILNRLAKIKDLTIIARTSMLPYAGSDKQIPQIARELNVGTVMEGSVRYAGERVRITAQLIEAKSGAHLWSEAYDRDFKDIFEIQSDIAVKITEAMKAEFNLAERTIISRAPTQNLKAYAHYVRGQARISGNPPDLIGAIQAYDEAIALDPKFALALATKAVIHGYAIYVTPQNYVLTETAQAKNIQLAREYAELALEIDPNQGNAYLALSTVSQAEHNWQQAFDYARKSYEVSRNVLTANAYGQWLSRFGNLEGGLEKFVEAMQLDPLNSNVPRFVAMEIGAYADWENATRFAEQARLMRPDRVEPYALLASIAAFRGENEKAYEYGRQAEEKGALPGFVVTGLMAAYRTIDLPDEVDRLSKAFYELEEKGLLNPFNRAEGYMAMGDRDRGFELLHQIVDNNFPTGIVTGLALFPDCDCFDLWRGDPRFNAALEKVRRLGVIPREK